MFFVYMFIIVIILLFIICLFLYFNSDNKNDNSIPPIDIDDIKKTLEEVKKLLNDAKNTLTETQERLKEFKKIAEEMQNKLNDLKNTLTETQERLKEFKKIADEAKSTLDESKTILSDSKNTLNESRTVLADSKNTLDESKAVLADSKNTLNESKAVLADSKATLEELKIITEKTKLFLNSRFTVILINDFHNQYEDMVFKDIINESKDILNKYELYTLYNVIYLKNIKIDTSNKGEILTMNWIKKDVGNAIGYIIKTQNDNYSIADLIIIKILNFTIEIPADIEYKDDKFNFYRIHYISKTDNTIKFSLYFLTVLDENTPITTDLDIIKKSKERLNTQFGKNPHENILYLFFSPLTNDQKQTISNYIFSDNDNTPLYDIFYNRELFTRVNDVSIYFGTLPIYNTYVKSYPHNNDFKQRRTQVLILLSKYDIVF